MRKFFLSVVAVVIMFATFATVSCQKDDGIEFREQSALTLLPLDSIEHIIPPGPIVSVVDDMALVRKLENPYSVVNMRLAYDGMSDVFEDVGLEEDDITTTHFYVKFKPDNEEELQLLKQRYLDYDIYEYPLDYEVSGRVSYHDPSLPDTVPTYQYMSIDSLAWNTIARPENVDFEVLERLYIPDEDLDIDISACTTRSGTLSYEEAIELLVNESMRLTGNLEDEEIDGNGTMGSNDKWYPSGRITAYDDIVDGQVPLQGVKVRVRRWFTTRNTYTDADGYFQFDKGFKKKVKYSIVWEGYDWDLRDGYVGQAHYCGPEQKGAWNLEIANDTYKSVRYAAMHRAVYRMFNGNTYGLSRPVEHLKISYFHGENEDNYMSGGRYYNRWCDINVQSDIWIFRDVNHTAMKVHEIIGVLFHELGHSAHCSIDHNAYEDADRNLKESWADFVAYYLTLKEYQDMGFSRGFQQQYTLENDTSNIIYLWDEPDDINRQYYAIRESNYYLPIFIDLYDSNNQLDMYRLEPDYNESVEVYLSDDDISNIPADIMEDFVFESANLLQIKNKLLAFRLSNTAEENEVYNLNAITMSNFFKPYTWLNNFVVTPMP